MTRFTPPVEAIEPFRLLDTSGSPLGATEMSPAATLEAFEWMLLARTFDEKATSLQRQGRFGTFSSVRGQEASVVGAASALDPSRDWIAPQYRELPAILRHGMPLENFALYFMGHPGGCVIPDGVNILPIQISLAAQLPQAVGVAWGLKQQGKDGVVTTFVGDGASSEGDFHESLNLAGVLKAPVIFFLQNNGWAISTPRAKQTAGRTFADRAAGYGIHGAYVDGNDLLAVNAVMTEAVERARSGEGPTLIESLTWRAGAHNTADDPTKYVTDADHEAWIGTDPIERIEAYLREAGELDDAALAQIGQRCAAEVERALGVAQGTPAAGPSALFDHVYAEPFARFSQQRDTWLQTQEV
jgi:pyruvate dehydrogenase E1 component alpha subunit